MWSSRISGIDPAPGDVLVPGVEGACGCRCRIPGEFLDLACPEVQLVQCRLRALVLSRETADVKGVALERLHETRLLLGTVGRGLEPDLLPECLVQGLLEIALNPKARDRDRIAATSLLLDRGWGKAPAFANIEGADPLGQDEIADAISELVDELSRRRDSRK
jgi:hypothetical protein